MIRVSDVTLVKELRIGNRGVFGVVIKEESNGFTMLYHDSYNIVTRYFKVENLMRIAD